MNYRLVGNHPEDTAEGAILAPGETTDELGSFDEYHPHNLRLISDGLLVAQEPPQQQTEAPKSSSKSTGGDSK